MMSIINKILDWFKSLFWKEEMELTLVGLQYSGKTTFVNVIAVSNATPKLIFFFGFRFAVVIDDNTMTSIFVSVLSLSQSGQFSEDMIPTVGFNMRKITKGNVTIKGS